MDIEKDLQAIIDYSYDLAKQFLEEDGEFYPFGVCIDSEGELIPIGYEDEESEFPSSDTVIAGLTQYFEKEIKSNKIKAYAIAYDVKIETENLKEKSDSLLIDVIHRDVEEFPIYYFPYELEGTKVNFKNGFSMNR